ncbi:hypothetical protein pgond44_14678 [Psychroflexus gondwanensis ACAM 44]|jgi:hypothetical protein|uniref:DUF4259 domain-containing protein n=1 Tax=Psychroflexus gondwanensis ACAM 44 TaxID=1189619 RepID=N1WHY6_9FLAO|nr:hypothetical protein [Psychroflexus gondwanensis]EMY79886.1 hypothetical protein pgond44_14678 [Psychroflexus gondwanensis ACAM 44]
MGTWGTAIKSNDTSADIYAEFFDLYNDGKEPNKIKEKLISDNPESSNDFWFALALALWETKSLPTEILEKVRQIIKSGSDLKLWEELDASKSDIKKRKIVLEKFLVKLESERLKAKARKKKKTKEPIFEMGTCLVFKLENGNYGGAIVLSSDSETGYGYNLIVTTKLNQLTKPTLDDIENSEVLINDFGNWQNSINWSWYLPDDSLTCIFEPIGKLEIDKIYHPNETKILVGYTANWDLISSSILKQLEHEKTNGKTKTFPTKRLIKNKKRKWWQLG